MRGGRVRIRWGEGALLGALLLVVLALALCAYYARQPKLQAVLAPPPVSREALEYASKIELNTADAARLMRIPGIGEKLAQRILEDRERNGAYAELDQLLRVEGIGEKKLAEMKKWLRLD